MSQLIGNIYIVVAPSGAGKTSLVAALLQAEPSVELSVSYSTRAARKGEIDGKHYHFVERSVFDAMVERGDFLEHAEVYGNCYGTSAPWIRGRLEAGQDILLEIDWQGAEQVRAVFPDAIGIFIAPPSIEELERRLRGRDTDAEEVILRRLASARAEIDKIAEYDYIVVNDDFERARQDLISIVRAQRLKSGPQCRRLAEMFRRMGTAGAQ
ncbi:guanylate kinase [Chromobacterium subtsugae]|uniref:Guanylate kinase n=1 Tax=Chromobacterium subtsugae TaxID=251747 RepID=A0ABS7FGL7_9NEIS|nr:MULTISPECIES: guanylate kinase [Chromobacterium]KUM05008.1 guanylate kinase [Chromobacterium subtsugae]KZE86361.1 guanylate kinase [Chromobacterium sp. F49]MBW7567988.1 guanylate kinase [Chromobacterium subtsugae]MBW8289215.1 guanylate kinase [Chromobacterium subtsugae]OBU86467.1 guanylate kinase [Chromobacterium subtsugae]